MSSVLDVLYKEPTQYGGSFSASLLGFAVRAAAALLPMLPFSTRISSSVFHAPQDGHFPAQFGVSLPHSEQTYTVFCLLAISFLLYITFCIV